MKLEILEYKFYDNTVRNIYILKPDKIYKNKKYKTLYMFDGKEVFIKSEYTNANWDVSKALEKHNVDDLFVIGFDNAKENRLNEYIPYTINHHNKAIKSKFDEFAAFIINDIIPDLEEKYPLNSNKESRFIAGSSAGAWSTLAFAAKYKDKFSAYGIFSLASWIAKMSKAKVFIEYIDECGLDKDSKYFVYVGDKEGYNKEFDIETKKVTDAYLNESKRLVKYFNKNKIRNFEYIIGENETHSEISWSKYITSFIEFIEK